MSWAQIAGSHWRSTAAALMLTIPGALATQASAAPECPHKDTLGTSRTLSVAVKETPRVGKQQFPATLPLEDREVVLTFDDGPFPPTTRKVLAALADQCVQATFFLIGQNAAHNPEVVRGMKEAGHTIAYHTWSHRILARLRENAAKDEINRGITAVEEILATPTAGSGPDDKRPSPTRFFRFPGFASTPKLLQYANEQNMVVFGSDFWASDWNRMSPTQELAQVTGRLKAARKGIILFHDIKAQTAAMLPAFLRYLKAGGYRVVHVVPAVETVGSSAK